MLSLGVEMGIGFDEIEFEQGWSKSLHTQELPCSFCTQTYRPTSGHTQCHPWHCNGVLMFHNIRFYLFQSVRNQLVPRTGGFQKTLKTNQIVAHACVPHV